jgi:hypothetical protein
VKLATVLGLARSQEPSLINFILDLKTHFSAAWNHGTFERHQMGCFNFGDGSAELAPCPVSSLLHLERLGSSLTDLDEELCPAPARRFSMSTKMNTTAVLRLRSVYRKSMNG